MATFLHLAHSSAQMAHRIGPRLARLLSEGFSTVELAAADDGGFGSLAALGVALRPLPLPPTGLGASPQAVGAWLASFVILQGHLLEAPPTLLHVQGDPLLCWMGAFCARRAGVPVVVATVEDHDLLRGAPAAAAPRLQALASRLPPPAAGALARARVELYRDIARRVDRYVVANEQDADDVLSFDVIPPAHLEVLPGGDGVDLDRFRPAEHGQSEHQASRRALGLPTDWRWILGYAGPLTRAAGTADLLALIAALRDTHPRAGWLVLPEHLADDSLLAALRQEQKRGAVRLLDPEQEPMLYRALDLYVSPDSRPESPPPLLRAAAMGRAQLAYATAGARSAVAQGQTGQLVETGDRGGLVATCRALLDDPKRLEDLGVRARARARQRFDARESDEQLLRLYDLLLAPRFA